MNQKTGATAIAVAGTFAAVSQHTASTASFLALVLTGEFRFPLLRLDASFFLPHNNSCLLLSFHFEALYYINGKLPKNP